MNKKWQIYETDESQVEEIAKKYNLNNLLATILVNRNIIQEQDIKLFSDLQTGTEREEDNHFGRYKI